MKRRDLILALLVVIVWGANFTVIKLGLAGLPPMLLVALRYTFAAIPAVFFIKRPDISWKYIFGYGMAVGVGQFSCLFYAMNIGMPAGTSSVILQAQAFFTLIFASVLLKESLRIFHILGLLIAAIGLLFISGHLGGTSEISSLPLGALFLTLLAAAFWGISNVIVRFASKQATAQGKTLDMFALVVWSCLIPPLPLFIFALILDTPETLLHIVLNLSGQSIFAILYLSFLATLVGFGLWSLLLSKYPAGKVAPLSLLVPITGLITAQGILGEQLLPIQWLGCGIIILGLIISNFGSTILQFFFTRKTI
ncbi:MAG: EamA family transporter [Acidaminococcaceae bacterium]